MQENEERRKNDEAFKFKIVESQAEIKSIIQSEKERTLILERQIGSLQIKLAEIGYALWGGPKESDIGLLEKHRQLNRTWTYVVGVVVFLANCFGYVAKAYISKWITAPVYESPAKAFIDDKKTRKVKHIHIRYTVPKPVDDSIDGDTETKKSEGTK